MVVCSSVAYRLTTSRSQGRLDMVAFWKEVAAKVRVMSSILNTFDIIYDRHHTTRAHPG